MALSSSITTVRRHGALSPHAPPLEVSASATAAAQPSCCGASPLGNGTPPRPLGARARKISRLGRPPMPATFEMRGARAITEIRPCTIVHGCSACEWRERKPSLHAREALRGWGFEGGAAAPAVLTAGSAFDHRVCRLHQGARKANESAFQVAAVEGGGNTTSAAMLGGKARMLSAGENDHVAMDTAPAVHVPIRAAYFELVRDIITQANHEVDLHRVCVTSGNGVVESGNGGGRRGRSKLGARARVATVRARRALYRRRGVPAPHAAMSGSGGIMSGAEMRFVPK
eukprot:scaffold23627_cov60-Phaeocystis_antarctica.AAC.6